MYRILKRAAVAAIVSASATLPGNAAIVGAVSAVINSGGPGFGDINNTLNQRGLSANYVSGVTDFDAFVAGTTHTTIFATYEWFSNVGSTSASVTYDLGSAISINKMALWNEESSGISLLNLLVSGDGTSFTTLLSGLIPTDHTTVDYLADVFTFATSSFRYLRMDMSGCPQPVVGSFAACAIGEVAFSTAPDVAPVPVPAAGVLLFGAIGALGLLKRRRKAA